MSHIFERLRAEAAGVYRIVRSYPSTLLWPLLLLGMVLGLGIWGVNHVSRVEEDSHKDQALTFAATSAMIFSQYMEASISPVHLMAAMVQYNPQYDTVHNIFAAMAPALLAQTPLGIPQALELLPNGVVRDAYPPTDNEAAIGWNLFASKDDAQMASQMIQNNITTLSGPIQFIQGGSGFIVQTPIFVSGVEPNETFGIPDPLDPYCGSSCDYDASRRTKFWGIAAALIDLDALRAYMSVQLASLESFGFRYEVRGLDFTNDTILAASTTPPSDPVEATATIVDKKVVVYVAPKGGWKSRGFGSLQAGVIVLAVALALLMFAALVSRKRHQMLLEALLPKELIKDLHDTDTTLLDAMILQAETTADLMLSLLNRLLEGYMPDLRDVVYIRQAIIRGVDLYQPTDLRQHIKNANLDKDVARSLMQQLGHETVRSSFINASCHDISMDEDPYGGGSPPTGGSIANSGSCPFQRSQQVQQQQGYATLTGALALILAPHPTSLRETHESMSGDTISETAATPLLTKDVGNTSGGGGVVVACSPRPSNFNFASRAMTFLRDGGGGGGGNTTTIAAIPSSAVSCMNMEVSTQQAQELVAAAAVMALPPSVDVPEAMLPPLRQRALMSMVDLPASALAGGDDETGQPRCSATSTTSAALHDDCMMVNTGPRVRRPPRKVASALGPGAFGTNARRRSLLLSLTNSPIGGGGGCGGGGGSGSVVGCGVVSGGGVGGSGVLPLPPSVPAALNSCARRISVTSMVEGTGAQQPLPETYMGNSGEQPVAAGSNRMMVSLGASRRNLTAGATRAFKPPQNLQPPPTVPPPVLEEVERVLSLSDSWHFDTWRLRDVTNGRPLSALGFYLIHRAGLIERLNLKAAALARLLCHIEAGYNDNPYHNATHAADVLQTLHVIIHGGQMHVHYLDKLGLLAAYFAAIVHDYGHPGLTNDFLVATSDPLAVRYNDRSPLENHHAAAAFGLLQRPGLDALAPLSKPERAVFRKLVIDMVLATDVKQHFALLSQFNTAHRLASFAHTPATATKSNPVTRISAGNLDLKEIVVDIGADCKHLAPKPLDDTERLLSLQLAIKAADLGHLGEELEVHQRWLCSLEEEFFRQGDKERQLGIPISPLFDRSKQGVSKSQVGFYDFLALPLVHALCSAFPGTQPLMTCFLGNYHYWKSVEGNASVVAQVAQKRASTSVRPELSASQLPDLEKGKVV